MAEPVSAAAVELAAELSVNDYSETHQYKA